MYGIYLHLSILTLHLANCLLHHHNNESLVIAHIMKNYNKSILPADTGDNVKVKIGISLTQIVDIEEIKEHAVINANVRQLWNDPQLTWDADQFGGVKKINLKAKDIWLPDIRLFSNVEPDKSYNGFLDTSLTMVQLKNNGDLKWLIPIIFRIHCHINVADFPFDQQSCVYEFGSWTYDTGSLDLWPQQSSADLTEYAGNEEWHLQSMPAVRHEYKYVCCEETFSVVTFTMNIKRKPLFCILNLLLPSGIFSTISLIVYMLPSEAAERASFAVNWLLAMAFFMTNAISILPDSSESIPLYSRFQGLALTNMFLLIVTLCYTLSIHYADVKVAVMPFWVRKYVLGKLRKCLRINVRVDFSEAQALENELIQLFSKPLNRSLGPSHPGRLWRPAEIKESCMRFKLDQSLFNDDEFCACASELLTVILCSMQQEERWAVQKSEWRAVAKTLDAVCAIVFSTLFIAIIVYCAM